MNKNRRARIVEIIVKVKEIRDEIDRNEYFDEQVQATALIKVNPQISELRDEEQKYFDAMPESFKEGNKGDAAQCAINGLYNAIAFLNEAACLLGDDMTLVDDIIYQLDDAIAALRTASA